MKRPYAEALRLAMSEKGITQDQLAAEVGISQTTISNVLRGKGPRLSTADAIERVLPRVSKLRHGSNTSKRRGSASDSVPAVA